MTGCAPAARLMPSQRLVQSLNGLHKPVFGGGEREFSLFAEKNKVLKLPCLKEKQKSGLI